MALSHSQEHSGGVGTSCWQKHFDHDDPEQIIIIYKIYETVHISKYLTFLHGIKNEFVSIFFVIGVLVILVILGLHVARRRGCIDKWKLYSN